jgi:hypothetical protein
LKQIAQPLVVALLGILLGGCAAAPTVPERPAAEDEISQILSGRVDDAEYDESKRCLAAHEYRGFRVLDDRHIVFEGSRGKLWLSTLPMRCPDLRFATALQVKSTFPTGRICAMDTIRAGDWFDWPWYRRWPWRWGSTWPAGAGCTLGEFQPVSESQIEAIRAALR